MGWKGTMRSISAASRAASRDAERRSKAAYKAQMLEDAADSVSLWEDYISSLTSLHTNLADAIDWVQIASVPKPISPKRESKNEDIAKHNLHKFKPGMLDFLSGGTKRKAKRLERKVTAAKSKDDTDFANNVNKYNKNRDEWEQESGIAKKLLAGDLEAYKQVLTELHSLGCDERIGKDVEYQFKKHKLHAIVSTHTEEIIPSIRRKLRASGSLSETKMPRAEFNELYQDYIASVALKVAGDVFHVLPIDSVYVTCRTRMLNKATGHQENTPILSVQFVRDTFKTLNLKHIDPSDSLNNFNHVMSFKRTAGFAPIKPIVKISA